jgi:hypothetical protein
VIKAISAVLVGKTYDRTGPTQMSLPHACGELPVPASDLIGTPFSRGRGESGEENEERSPTLARRTALGIAESFAVQS